MQRFIAPLFIAPLVAATLALASLGACGKDKAAASKAYPETTEGLEQLIADLGALSRSDDKAAASLANSLRPDDAGAWFAAHFKPEVARRLTAELESRLDQYAGLGKVIAAQQARGRTVITAEAFTDATDDAATGVQSLALRAMTKPAALYSVRMVEPGKKSGFHLYSFVYDNGRFRLVGKMKKADDKPPGSAELQALGEIRVRDARVFLETGKLPD